MDVEPRAKAIIASLLRHEAMFKRMSANACRDFPSDADRLDDEAEYLESLTKAFDNDDS